MRFVLALLVLVRLAHADSGVVVAGDPNMQATVLDHVQRWLQDKKHSLIAAPLGASSMRLVDCFVMEDVACAKKVFDDDAKAATVVFVRVDMVAGQSRDYMMTAYWFTKGAEPVNDKRPCNACDDAALGRAVDDLMGDLSRSAAHGKGRLRISGTTKGMTVKVDGQVLGAPPVDRELAAGSHELVFLQGDAPVDVRRIDVEAGGVVELEAPHVVDREKPAKAGRSRGLAAGLVVGGLAAAAAGGVMLYYGSLRGPDEPYVYTNATEIGLPLVIAGAFAVGAGTSLWFSRSGSDSQVGVAGTF